MLRLAWLPLAMVLLLAVLFRPLGEPRSTQVVNVATLILALLGGWACMAVSGRRGTGDTAVRAGWSVAGTGAFLFAISQAALLADEFGLLRAPALEVSGRVTYLAAFPAFLLGSILIAFGYGRSAGLRPLADALCALGGVGLLSWYWILTPIAERFRLAPGAGVIALSGPLLDLEIAFAAFLLLYLPAVPPAARWLAAGLPLVALGDSLLAYGTLAGLPLNAATGALRGAAEMGRWSELTWAVGLALVATAPFAGEMSEAADQDEAATNASPWSWKATLAVVGVGTVALAAAFAILITEWQRSHDALDWHIVVVCFGLVGATLAHQVFSVAAHGHASNRLHGSNQALEETVAARNQQLQVLHEIVRAATGSLDVREVLDQILQRTAQALAADATAIWLLEDSPDGYRDLRLHAQAGFEAPEHRALLNTIPSRWNRGLERMLVERRSVPVACEARDAAGTRAEVWCAPLEWRGKTMGVLGAARWVGGLGRTERNLQQAVALEVAVALQNARLYYLAVEAADHDGVTGLLNHRAIVQQAAVHVREAAEMDQPLAVILADLDNFKRINDTHGHLCGDQILKTFAGLLRECCREQDLAGRYGGDEFILVCPGMDAEGARTYAERLKARLRETVVPQPGGGTLPVSASFGVAIYPNGAGSQHELLALADVNLYESKARGSGTIVGLDQDEVKEPIVAGSFSTLDALVTAVDNRDHYTRRHSEDVTEYSLMIARELGWSEETARTLRIAGLLHDVGKIMIPDSILRKPGALTDDEYDVMKQHPIYGWLIVGAIPSLAETLPAIRHHHERWDGRGYPDALEGEEIPAMGRLMAVADAFSAMTTDRPYRKGMSVTEAVKRIREGIGTQFDPEMAQAFLRALEARGDLLPEPELVAAGGRGTTWVG